MKMDAPVAEFFRFREDGFFDLKHRKRLQKEKPPPETKKIPGSPACERRMVALNFLCAVLCSMFID